MEISRYHRQEILPFWGKEGQEKLSRARVTILGCGALGSFQANLLARAGVGHLLLLDRDLLEYHNLQRQFLYDEKQVELGLPKAIAAKQRLLAINSEIEVTARVQDVHNGNIEEIVMSSDLLLDATDNFTTRYLLNEACIKHQKPWIYGACVGTYGLTMNVLPQQACFQCVFEEAPSQSPTCDTAGVLNAIAGNIASIQVAEALKWLLGQHEKMRQGVLHLDLWESVFQEMKIHKVRPTCEACQQKKWDYLEGRKGEQWVVLCGRNAIQIRPHREETISLDEYAKKLSVHGKVRKNEYLLKCEIPQGQITLFLDGRVLLEGISDLVQAKKIYSNLIQS